jgi:[acyl-carrier-protein] S-malonyltransferase
VPISKPGVPVMSNVTARPHGDAEAIRSNLVRQITGEVRWRESIEWLAEQGVDRFVELGPGKVLSGLVRRIVPNAEAMSASTPDELRTLAETLAKEKEVVESG